LLPATWNTGRFLGILKKDKQGEMPKNRAEKNRAAVFLFFIKQILTCCCVGAVAKL
jgi:hypothetical protein